MKTRRSSPSKLLIRFFLLHIATLTAFCADQPWRELFNGKDFTGWNILGGVGHAWVENGEIRGHMVRGPAEHTFIHTQEKFGDFILELDSYQTGGVNSGILFRCEDTPPEAKILLHGYQVKIDPSPTRLWTGGIYSNFGDSWHWYYTLKNDERARAAFKPNQWIRYRIEAIGSTLKVWVNGVPTANLKHEDYTNGYIALKIHYLRENGKPGAERKTIQFKNIRIITDNPEQHTQPMDLPTLEADPTEVIHYVPKPAPPAKQ